LPRPGSDGLVALRPRTVPDGWDATIKVPVRVEIMKGGKWMEHGNLGGGFRKWWYPQIIHFNRVFHYKPSILGYPYFWKHPGGGFKKKQYIAEKSRHQHGAIDRTCGFKYISFIFTPYYLGKISNLTI